MILKALITDAALSGNRTALSGLLWERARVHGGQPPPISHERAWTGGGEERPVMRHADGLRLRCSHQGIGPQSYFFRSGRINAVKWTRC